MLRSHRRIVFRTTPGRAAAVAVAVGLGLGLGGNALADAPAGEPDEMEVPPPPPPPPAEPAPPAPMAEEDDCFWLPDIRCGRHGRWEGFQKPIVQPYLFEDPFITTGIYPYYAWHEFPGSSALRGGEVHIAAAQARLAITPRLAFIATKDGYNWLRPDNPILPDTEGWFNIAIGLKYAFLELPEDDFIASAALRVEVPVGANDTFDGGDGGVIFMPSVSAAWGLDRLHLIAGLGGQIPTDGDNYTSNVFYHLYADYAVHEHFQPFVQLSGIHYVESGDGHRIIRLRDGTEIQLATAQAALGTGPFEGVDVHNLGSPGMDNEDYATWAVGVHFPINPHLTFSAAYERPFTDRKDITKQRVTTSVRIEF